MSEDTAALSGTDVSLRIEDGEPVLELPQAKIRLRTFLRVEAANEPLGDRNAETSAEVDCDGENGCWWTVFKDETDQAVEYPAVTIQPEVIDDE